MFLIGRVSLEMRKRILGITWSKRQKLVAMGQYQKLKLDKSRGSFRGGGFLTVDSLGAFFVGVTPEKFSQPLLDP